MKLNHWGRLVIKEWLQTPEVRPYIELDAFVVMPNHFHGVFLLHEFKDVTKREGATHRVAPTLKDRPSGPVSASVGAIIGQFKSRVTKRINDLRQKPGGPIWQRNYYEHVIRDDDDLNRIREYVENNPARWLEDENYPENL